MRIEEIGRSLTDRLRERRAEIEQAALTRVYSVSGSVEGSDPEYLDGLRAAVSAALDYGIEALERSEERPAAIPTALLSQARLAARNDIELDTVLRRYLAGHTLLGDFLIEESERGGSLSGTSLKQLLRLQATALDRLLAAVSEEYAREGKVRPGSVEQRRLERVERLLAGELIDAAGLAYDFEHHHLGVVARGAGGLEAINGPAKSLDCRCLIVQPDESTTWAWFGGRRKVDAEELKRHVAENWPAEVALAIGEPGLGFAGWRFTHRQARAALPIAQRGGRVPTRYADVALLAAVLQDDLLATSLRELYLVPLATARDGGAVLRETLRAYFEASRNASSAAAALGVSRQTVNSRLHAVEERLDLSLDCCTAELEAALRLYDLATSPAA